MESTAIDANVALSELNSDSTNDKALARLKSLSSSLHDAYI